MDDQWMVSYDEGTSWIKVEGQTSSVSLFESVQADANQAVFTLTDGTVIILPLANAADKLQLIFNESAFEKMRDGEVLSTAYKIVAPEGVKTDLQTFESNGWTVTIYSTDEKSGRISIKAPAKVTPTKVMFLLTDDNGGSFVKIINIGYNEEAKPEVQTQYVVDPNGGELDDEHDDDERAHGLHQRDAGSLDGCQLRALAQVAEGYQRRQQDGQREGLRHQHQSHIPEKLGHHLQRQALAYQLVHIAPQKLHHQHKLADEERRKKQQPELFGDEDV